MCRHTDLSMLGMGVLWVQPELGQQCSPSGFRAPTVTICPGLQCHSKSLSFSLRTNSPLGSPTVFDYSSGEENIFLQSLILKGAKFSSQNRSWNSISWSLQKSDSIYLLPCFIFIQIYLSCFVFQSRGHSALCKAGLGGMFHQEVLAVLWCAPHHTLLLTRHWGLIAHLVFGGLFFRNRYSRIWRVILKKKWN